MIGRTLSHFHILARLGEGGMGVVYRAEDTRLRRQVALKVLPAELVANEERRMRFLREARAAAAVTHPNIATVHEIDEAEGVVFIAMELVEGKTLRERIGGRPMPVREALRIATQMAEGLARAHQGRIVHRDFKPDNVMVGPDGHVKILDFGLAKLMEERPGRGSPDLSRLETISGEMTREGRIFGTTSYMSPEQARGQEVDPRSDIFSFGSSLYEMVTGRVPFQGKSVTDTLSAIIRDEPTPPTQVNSEIPSQLGEIIGKCLEKRPEERYQDTRDLAVDLRRLWRTTDSAVQAVRTPSGPAQAVRGSRWRTIVQTPAVRLGGGALTLLSIVALLVAFDVGGVRRRLIGSAPAGPIDSLAVLPLDNLSGDPQQEYFADGMTEELIATLSKISALRVISRTSAMRYKESDKSLPEIARELDVDAILEGSVRRAEDRVRITVQLVEAATDRHLWADSFEGKVRDVLAVQARMAREMAEQIRVVLTPEEAKRLATGRQVDPKAHEAYLMGLHFLSRDDWVSASRSFEEAIAVDPTHIGAHFRLTIIYRNLWEFSDDLTQEESLVKAKREAQRVVALDAGSSEAFLASAAIKRIEWDWAGAEEDYRKGLESDPGNAISRAGLALVLSTQGRHDEAQAEMNAAVRLDPASGLLHRWKGISLYHARRYPEAMTQFKRALELDPGNTLARFWLADVLVDAGRVEEGIAEYRRTLGSPAFGAHSSDLTVTGLIHALAGETAKAREILERIRERSERSYIPALWVAAIAAALEDADETLYWLEKSLREGDPAIAGIKVELRYDFLRRDPRFADLLRRMGLPPD